MDSHIEIQRQTHEEVERLERALSTVLSRPQPTHDKHIANEHKASQILDRICSRLYSLNELYHDEDARKTEIDLLSVPPQPSEELTEFYNRLTRIKEHHARYPELLAGTFEAELARLVDEPLAEEGFEEEDPISLLFSGEESYGRYLDLYANHTAYNNLKHLDKRLPYLQYIDVLANIKDEPVHHELSKETRLSKEYDAYLVSLHSYLISFTKRTKPLVDVVADQKVATEEFERLWDEGQITGWDESSSKAQPSNGAAGVWCAACQKHYAKQTVYDAHLTSKKHLKATVRATANPPNPPANPNGDTDASATPAQAKQHPTPAISKTRATALLTHLTTAVLRPLLPVLQETKNNVERRSALTARERELELTEAQPSTAPPLTSATGEVAAEEEEEEERIYNPLKLPLGWDGKPIPYWLYKLHGLGVEYRCEICSDHVYMGRKNFDRHFQESRHAFGMRALGLPNTKHFHEITRIEDALALAEKLKQEGRQEMFQQETMEELEDDDGNVYNRKTYDDLKKQGLI